MESNHEKKEIKSQTSKNYDMPEAIPPPPVGYLLWDSYQPNFPFNFHPPPLLIDPPPPPEKKIDEKVNFVVYKHTITCFSRKSHIII